MDANQKIIVQQHLDPIMETIGLINLTNSKSTFRNEWIEEINQFGINGEIFFDKHLSYLTEYVEEFEKKYIPHPEVAFYLGHKEDVFFIFMSYIILLNREWLTSFSSVTEEAILTQLLPLIASKAKNQEVEISLYSVRTTDKFIQFLEQCDLDEHTKWKVLKVFCYPKEVLSTWITIVNDNIQAYEEAIKAIQPKVNKLYQSFPEAIANAKYPAYKNIIDGIHHDKVFVFPSLVFSESLLVYRNHVYYGLVVDSIPLQSDTPEELRDYLIMRLKSFADLSKLQIISFLKQGEKYNLEISEHLGITAATTSHHMNVLLATGFIGINKQNGRVYYHLVHEELKGFIDKLEQYLL